jgi:hypothetical protein
MPNRKCPKLIHIGISAHSLSGTSYLIHSNTLGPPLSKKDIKRWLDTLNAAEVFGDTLGKYTCEADQHTSRKRIDKANITAALSMACDTVLGKGVVPLSSIKQLNIITNLRSRSGGWSWIWGRPKGTIADLSASIFKNENETRTALSVRKTCEKYKIEYEVDDAKLFERDRIYLSDPSVITQLIERKRRLLSEEREGSDTSISG